MEQEKQAPNEPTELLTPNVPGHQDTNNEDGGGRVNIPTSTPPDGDAD